ncbi:cilia- and flagella-associated protein 221-like [Lingula anatina]|uniref:Cilia- and flagella-associated protein 221-like n=1 Tax=Lingula anatina TaxID=7574 RepID=A0A2R2MIT0_LINAN|nr:cilia- and flagella-associated protein 221-like [Lingula anatina]|eukprot:XP_023930131.1 cilia- and flagella-associated protein 221-like [Lingula anatina]
MAATQPMTRTFGINGTRTTGKLLDLQLVEPSKPIKVPNHLLDSKIYAKVGQNLVVQATPSIIYYGGFELGKVHKVELHIGNVDTEVIRMHVIPPQTKYFDIKYKKQERLVPGMTLDCVVEFIPDEWRYYYDCIRINCKNEENLVIPIHAYPVMNTASFPTHVDFPSVPIGQQFSKTIPLKCDAPIDFEFQLSFLQPHPTFTVEPMSGMVPANGEVEITVTFAPTEFLTAHMKLQLVISQFNSKPLVCTFTGTSKPGLANLSMVPANGEVEITVTFAPTEFLTAHMKLQLVISQFNSKPLVCTFTGTSKPGLAKERTEMKQDLEEPEMNGMLDPRSLTPVDRARSRREKTKTSRSKPSTSRTLGPPQPKEVERDGIRFPPGLDTPYAIAQVLNQQAGKLRVKDLRDAIEAAKESSAPSSRQMKEAVFEQAVRKNVYEERQNQLRWQVKVGDDPIPNKRKVNVLGAREEAWKIYKMQRGDPLPVEEYNRTCTQCTFRRTVRYYTQLGKEDVKFDTFVNNPWAVRQAALDKFAQAARTVLVRCRADNKIRGLKTMVLDWGKKKEKKANSGDGDEDEEEEEEEEESQTGPEMLQETLHSEKIHRQNFPYYVPPDIKDDMAPDALDFVPVEQTEVEVKKKVPYYNLKVPQQYRLQGYKPHSVQAASSGYVHPRLTRQLRTGAEDEVINIPVPATMKLATSHEAEKEAETEREITAVEADLMLEDVRGDEAMSPQQEPVTLRPPEALFNPIEYVPQQYRLQGYKPHSVQAASSGYVHPRLTRQLRTGAEDEVINIPVPATMKLDTSHEAEKEAETEREITAIEADLMLEDVRGDEAMSPQQEPVTLRPPEALFNPIEYPPLHIFNPAPGLQVFQTPLPYAEVDQDFHLCPLPRYYRNDEHNPHATTQKKYLDREDIIKGAMTWKKFPSQGLTSLANTPTLTNVWVPRWTDPFSNDMLPEEVPLLFDGLAEEDKEHIMDEEDQGDDDHTKIDPIQLTPEMVNAQFSLIDPSQVPEEKDKHASEVFPHGNKMPLTNVPVGVAGPVPREKREQELDFFLNKKYNRLGSKIQSRVDTMSKLTTKPELILK